MNSKGKEIRIALDLDETVFNTVGYLFEEMYKRFGSPEGLSSRELIQKYRYTFNVPYWNNQEAKQWVEERINCNELQEILPLIEGVDIYVPRINEIIPIAAYITTRPEKVVEGTKVALKNNSLPLVPIIARPISVPGSEGQSWKAKVLNDFYPEISGIVDDNLGLVKAMEEINPNYNGSIFLFNHSNKPETNLEVMACENWEAVYKKVVEKYS